jgi:hypothetical protein
LNRSTAGLAEAEASADFLLVAAWRSAAAITRERREPSVRIFMFRAMPRAGG